MVLLKDNDLSDRPPELQLYRLQHPPSSVTFPIYLTLQFLTLQSLTLQSRITHSSRLHRRASDSSTPIEVHTTISNVRCSLAFTSSTPHLTIPHSRRAEINSERAISAEVPGPRRTSDPIQLNPPLTHSISLCVSSCHKTRVRTRRPRAEQSRNPFELPFSTHRGQAIRPDISCAGSRGGRTALWQLRL